ncbi:MAG TPA: hypothetical protein PK633_06815 [Agitococcus sp.]|nr:hypothetical protein [Agitococcus sp.]HNH43788.1 hypothetical protein [Agitococcus sp.]
MLTLCLAGITLSLPKSLTAINLHTTTSPNTLKDAYLLLSAQQQTPSYIAFSANTPSLLLLASQQCWPDASYLLQENDRWLELPSGEYWSLSETNTPTNTTVITKSETSVATENENTEPQTPAALNITAVSPKKDKELLAEVFKFASWGEHESEHRAQLDELFSELLKRSERNPELMQNAQKQRNLGTQAYNKWIACERRLKSGGFSVEFETWFQGQIDNTNPAIAQYLKYKLKRWQTWSNNKRQQFAANTTCQLAPISFDDHHPNSLRHLPTHHHWQILIDETGSEFDNSKHLSVHDTKLGRMVALAIPVNKVNLPPLKNNFHATNESDAILDATIKTLLDNRVGIVGITVNDALLGKSSRWFSGIYLLMRMVLRLLPINGQGKVEFFIEQRSSFDANMSLFPIQQLLETELQALDAERFKHVSIALQFAHKNHHPANGYVDALAHLWAAGSANSKTRLKRSALRGHCLLEPQHDVIERSYAAIDQQHILSPKDWYVLVSAVSNEPSSSLLHNVLAELGKHIQQQTTIWQGYLAFVNQLLQHKNYHLLELKTALDWLANYTPKECALPPMLTLHWYMARLACANHLGQHDLPLLSQSLTLAQGLLDENAMEVCHLHLRIAVAATNQFEFDSAQDILDFWQSQDPRLMGLNNYGKYLSSLGQLAAFRGQNNQAISYFDQAIRTFDQLSDPQEKRKQQRQTEIYRLIALTDNEGVSDQALQQALEAFWQKPLASIATLLGRSDNDQRFEQHLLLRVMVTRPALQQDSYLETASDWQFEQTHPWPLIAAYRAVLLQTKQPIKASLWMHKAINTCREAQGATLQWMGEILALWVQQYGIQIDALPSKSLQQLQTQLPHAPWTSLEKLKNASNRSQAMQGLIACLPFNFH